MFLKGAYLVWVSLIEKKNNAFYFSLVEDYIAAIDGVIEHLVHRTPNEKYVYVGELINGKDFKPVSLMRF